MLKDIILLFVLGIASYFDLKMRIVPNKLIYPALIIGLLLALINKDCETIIVTLLIFSILRYIYSKNPNILPGGDIKMLLFISLIGGIDFFIKVLYYIILISIVCILYYKRKEKRGTDKLTVPLAVPMFLGCIIVLGGSYATKIF